MSDTVAIFHVTRI